MLRHLLRTLFLSSKAASIRVLKLPSDLLYSTALACLPAGRYTLDMPECIFCKIIRGDLPSYKVYEDDRVMAFLDIRPVNSGHTLVAPKAHSQNVFDISPEDWAALTEGVRKLGIAIGKGE